MIISLRQKFSEPFFAADGPPRWPRTLTMSVLITLIAMLAAYGTLGNLTGYFFIRQDVLPGFLIIALSVYLSNRQNVANGSTNTDMTVPLPALLLGGVALILAGGWLGQSTIMHGYNLSRDEQMAVQDAIIFADGKFMFALPPEWHELAATLLRDFNSTMFRSDMTVSGYRPVNALAHAIMGTFGLMALTAPLFAALGLIATWRVARRIWPEDAVPQAVAVLFYLCSSQMWAASMTTYAMSMLLGLNMIWLALFLRRDWIGHLLTLPIGFLAVGIHQVPYHLMFVAPFIAMTVFDRRWRIAVLYGAAYAAFALFWFRYEEIVSFVIGGAVLKASAPTVTGKIGGYFSAQPITDRIAYSAANLLRFLTWQHMLTLPLLFVGVRAAMRDRHWLLLAMGVACILPLAIKFMQAPYQGHGWGYRYLHGAIGLSCILAAAGWQELCRHRSARSGDLKLATAATLLILMPWQFWHASTFSGGYAEVDQRLKAIDSDIVIIDSRAANYANDLVTNRPDLKNRPIRIVADEVRARDIGKLCTMGSIALFPGSLLGPIQELYREPAETSPEFHRITRQFQVTCPSAMLVP